jgi:hypothetical protein
MNAGQSTLSITARSCDGTEATVEGSELFNNVRVSIYGGEVIAIPPDIVNQVALAMLRIAGIMDARRSLADAQAAGFKVIPL